MENNKAESKVKIIISYHKKDALLKDDILTPMHGGRELAINNHHPDLDWLTENMIGDNTGENITAKNSSYNELTNIYWAWKNYMMLGDPDYIGFMHYRRHFLFSGGGKCVYEFGDIDDHYLKDQLGYSSEMIHTLVESYDLIVPMAQWRISMYEHFKRSHDITDLDIAVEILAEKYPDLAADAKQYLDGEGAYFCNMFIMPRALFFEYAEYLFTILSAFENRVDIAGKRLYISEWLTGIFIQNQINIEKNICFLPISVAEHSHEIPLFFASDNKGAIQLGVALTSLLKNAKPETCYMVRILISEDFSLENQNKVSSLLNEYSNHSFTFFVVNEEEFQGVTVNTKHLTKVTFYRLLAAELFSDWDKCVYLDIDVIVLQDLTIMYRNSLDHNLIAGVKAPGYMYPVEWRNKKINELSLPSMEQYVNGGVLIMDLEKMREEKVTEFFIELTKQNLSSEDQDVINVACYNRIKHLPYKFNAMTKYTNPRSSERYKALNVFPKDWVEEAESNPVIIHYANAEKPWMNLEQHQADLWLEYAHISPYKDELRVFRAEKQHVAQLMELKLNYINRFLKYSNIRPVSIPDHSQIDGNYEISIIMPIFNSADTLCESLDSAIIQAELMNHTIEIICIDDGSTDHSLHILCAYAEHFDFIKIITQANEGSGAARNKGLLAAKGEYIAFLDSDDWYPSVTTLENLYYTAKKNEALICGGCFCSSPSKNGQIFTNYKTPLDGYVFKKREFVDYAEYQFDFGYTRFIYKTEFLRDNEIVFPKYARYQDPIFFVKAMTVAGRFYTVPELTYKYRVDKKILNWDIKKISDLLCALTEMFSFSHQNNFDRLHGYTYLRFKDHYGVIHAQLKDNDSAISPLLIKLFTSMNADLLRKSGLLIDEAGLDTPENMLDYFHAKMEQDSEGLHFKTSLAEEGREQTKYERMQMEIERVRAEKEEMEGNFNQYIEDLHRSWTWRAGRVIIWLPGMLKKLLKGKL